MLLVMNTFLNHTKFSISFVSLLFISCVIFASPSYAAGKSIQYIGTHIFTSPYGTSESVAIDTDDEGGVYIGGLIIDAVDFNKSDGVANYAGTVWDGESVSTFDPFIVKYDSDDHFEWVHTFGPGVPDEVHDVMVDRNRVYLSGESGRTVDFDDSSTKQDIHVFDKDDGINPFFTTIYNLDGDYRETWIGVGGKMDSDTLGNLYFAGTFEGEHDFDRSGKTDIHEADEFEKRGYLTSYSRDGSYRWTRIFGDSDTLRVNDVVVDKNSNVYVVGAMTEMPIMTKSGSSVEEVLSSELSALFISKYTSDGSYEWTRYFEEDKNFNEGTALALDADQNILVLGRISGNLSLDTVSGYTTVKNQEAWGSVVMKMRPDSQVLWARGLTLLAKVYDSSVYEVLTGTDIEVDQRDGQVLVSGSFTGASHLGDVSGKKFVSGHGRSSSFLSFLTEDGGFDGALSFEKMTDSYVTGEALSLSSDNDLLYTGVFGQHDAVVDFDAGPSVDAYVSENLRSAYYNRLKLKLSDSQNEPTSEPAKQNSGDVPEKEQMISRIQELLDLIAVLKAQLSASESESISTQSTPVFNRNLGLGDKGSDVEQLQRYFAKDNLLYPEGEVTGYYGNLTKQAVERFQCAQSIVCSGTMDTTGFGAIGPVTLAKLNELIGQ